MYVRLSGYRTLSVGLVIEPQKMLINSSLLRKAYAISQITLLVHSMSTLNK